MKLRTALPFPEIDWNDGDARENIAKLRDYAESLANGAIDWYLQTKRWKKRSAQTLHWIKYIFAGLAAAGPLVKISALLDMPFIKGLMPDIVNSCNNSFVAELTVLLASIAGAAAILDRVGGYTVDWMRYITTAARLNQELIQFQFDWERLEWSNRETPEPVVKEYFDLASGFCLNTLKIVGDETATWSEEVRKRTDRPDVASPQPKKT